MSTKQAQTKEAKLLLKLLDLLEEFENKDHKECEKDSYNCKHMEPIISFIETYAKIEGSGFATAAFSTVYAVALGVPISELREAAHKTELEILANEVVEQTKGESK